MMLVQQVALLVSERQINMSSVSDEPKGLTLNEGQTAMTCMVAP
jgi:hypothetical protein